MATPEQLGFLKDEAAKARLGGHIWPEFAACEAAVETAWGTSQLYRKGNNVFGEKQHAKPIFLTVALPTREFAGGEWTDVLANFVWFPSTIEAFAQRMKTLAAQGFPEYKAALAAASGEAFVTEVSKRWSTDPNRAATVLEIYNVHKSVFASPEQEQA